MTRTKFIIVAFRARVELGRLEFWADSYEEAEHDGSVDLHRKLRLGLFDDTVSFVTVPAPANG